MICSNEQCGRPLGPDAAILIVGDVVSRYCSVSCIEPTYDDLLLLARAASYRGDEGPEQFSQRVDRLMAKHTH